MSDGALFPIMVSDYRFSEMARSARSEGCVMLVIQIPWAMIAPHEAQAQKNHSQSLERLAQRGGLNAAEAVSVLEDRRHQPMPFGASHVRLTQLVLDWEVKAIVAERQGASA